MSEKHEIEVRLLSLAQSFLCTHLSNFIFFDLTTSKLPKCLTYFSQGLA